MTQHYIYINKKYKKDGFEIRLINLKASLLLCEINWDKINANKLATISLTVFFLTIIAN